MLYTNKTVPDILGFDFFHSTLSLNVHIVLFGCSSLICTAVYVIFHCKNKLIWIVPVFALGTTLF